MKNSAEILKNCPKGTKLYSPICGECELETFSSNYSHIVVKHIGKDNLIHFTTFNSDGTYCDTGECLLFPSKDNRNWDRFCPFKNGDILVGNVGKPFIFNRIDGENVFSHCGIDSSRNFWKASSNWTLVESLRFATEKEKQQLFDVIKENRYKWNADTKTLEKLVEPKFKVGDTIILLSNKDIKHTITEITDKCYLTRTSEGKYGCLMIENQNIFELVTEPKFKIGDTVRIKGTDIGGIIKEIKRGQYIVQIHHSSQIMVAWPKDLSLIKGLVEKEITPESLKSRICECENFFICPDDYGFKDEKGNVIETKKIILEKKTPKYPKTYEGCINILGGAAIIDIITYYYEKQLETLYKLLICRDAYWKIAGEKMGLGKPWELSIGTPIYYIYYNRTLGTIKKDYGDDIQGNVILAFPTEEMRDAFYKNFKELIEKCKEFL